MAAQRLAPTTTANPRPRRPAPTPLLALAPLLRRAPRLLDALPSLLDSDDDADVADLLLSRHRAHALQHAGRRLKVPARHLLYVRRAARGLQRVARLRGAARLRPLLRLLR